MPNKRTVSSNWNTRVTELCKILLEVTFTLEDEQICFTNFFSLTDNDRALIMNTFRTELSEFMFENGATGEGQLKHFIQAKGIIKIQ